MAKRFTDTNKYKKAFIRSLPGEYKLLWDFLYHDCDHAGIWIVDFEIAQKYVGDDMPVTKAVALTLFNDGEERIIELDGGKKWFLPGFIEFQYVKLSEKNRAHLSVISTLNRYGLLNKDLSIKQIEEKIKPLTSPLQGVKDKELDKDKDMEKEEGGMGETIPQGIVPEMVQQFAKLNPQYPFDPEVDYPAVREVAEKIARWQNIGEFIDPKNLSRIKLRWGELATHIKADTHLRKYSLSQINKHFQGIVQSLTSEKNGSHKQIPGAKPRAEVNPKGGFGKL